MIEFNPLYVFASRGITNPVSFMVKSGIPPRTASKIANNQSKVLKLDHLEKLCISLHCTPHDLLDWHESKDVIIHESHPLRTLNKDKMPGAEFYKAIKTLPLEKLKELEQVINALAAHEKESKS